MGRKRKSRNDLPERMYFKHGAYWYVGNRWQRLGVTISEAYRGYAEIIGQRENITTIRQIIDRYSTEVLPDKAQNTIINETPNLERLKKVFGNMKPRDIKPTDIYQYMDRRALMNGKTQTNSDKMTLSNLFNSAIKWNITDVNPCKQVKISS